jgi:hypothetical protein
MPYQKFSALFKSEVRRDTAPKAPKVPKVALPRANEGPALGGLAALGRGRVQKDEPTASAWTDAHEERAGIIEYDGWALRAWAEGFARLDPNRPPRDVPPRRWLRFVDDCGRFLDGGWAARAAEFGWGPLDLFGCDRERPFARVDHLGLLWLLRGGSIVELHRDRAILQTENGALQAYRRRPVEVSRVVLAWDLLSSEVVPPPDHLSTSLASLAGR